MQYIKRKGGTVLLFGGRQFYKMKTYNNGSSYWRCSMYKTMKCKGSATLTVSIALFFNTYFFYSGPACDSTALVYKSVLAVSSMNGSD